MEKLLEALPTFRNGQWRGKHPSKHSKTLELEIMRGC